MIHSLPLKRETLYITNYLSGLLLVTFPIVLNGAIMILAKVYLGIPLTYAFQWLGVNLVLTFLLYTFAVFAGMFTGHMAAQVFYYLIFNFLAVFLENVINNVLYDLLFGFYRTSSKFDVWSPFIIYLDCLTDFIIMKVALAQSWFILLLVYSFL